MLSDQQFSCKYRKSIPVEFSQIAEESPSKMLDKVLLFILLGLSNIADAAINIAGGNQFSAYVGDDVIIPWVYDHASDMLYVEWTFMNISSGTTQIVMTQLSGSSAMVVGGFNIVHNSNGNITLTNVQRTNNGSYICFVTYTVTSGQASVTGKADVIVDVKPKTDDCPCLDNCDMTKGLCVFVWVIISICIYVVVLFIIGVVWTCLHACGRCKNNPADYTNYSKYLLLVIFPFACGVWLARFKDSNILDDRLYPNGTMLHLTSLKVSDTGQYSCRASNGYGSIESSVVDLAVKGIPDEYCFDEYEQKRTPLPYDCIQPDTNTSSIEVGDCKPKLCRHSNQNETNTCRDGSQNCCAIFDFDILTVQCTDYQLSFLKVISCDCGLCRLKSVKIVGTVLLYPSGKVARFSKVYLNGNLETYANSKGSFKVHVDQNYASAVLTIVSDRSDVTTKVIDISDETTGTIYTTIYIVEEIVSKQIDPTEENIIYIGQDVYDQANAVAELHVPANAFVDALVELHTASVTLYVTYLDPTNITDVDVMPGLMYRVDEYGVTDYIETFGSFFVKVLDTRTGEKLALIKDINVAIGTSFRDYENIAALYKLNTDSGVWDIINFNGRFWGLIDSTDVSSWLTIGRSVFPGKICYFNVRMFEDSTLTTEIPVSRYQFFMQAVHIANRSSYETYGYTFAPSSNCFRTLCDGGSGYLEIWISNVEKASDEYLFPVNPKVHDEIGLSADKQNSVQYSVSAADPHLGIVYINSIEGPFFNPEASCLANSYNGNHLKFYFNDYIEKVYTQTLFFDNVSENAETVKLLSQRVWYQQRAEGYRLCFVKAKFTMQTEKHIKVQAVSYGGTNANITNEILGIREVNIFMPSAVCLEYKCSGTIDEQFSSDVYDFTRVRVSTDKSCSVETFSQFLVDTFSDMNPKNYNASSFTFYAPTVYSPSLGIYSASTSSGDIESARTTAKGECRSGKSMDYSSENPDVGVAVNFICP